MNAILAQLVTVLCARLGVAAPVTSLAVQGVLALAAALPPEKIEAGLLEAWKWMASRPKGPDGNPDFGGNVQAENPPVVLGQQMQDPDSFLP